MVKVDNEFILSDLRKQKTEEVLTKVERNTLINPVGQFFTFCGLFKLSYACQLGH